MMSQKDKLFNLIKPYIKECTEIIINDESFPNGNTQEISHFGGDPYFEKGETWPTSKNDNVPLDFVFQIFNAPCICMPDEIALLQFYYSHELAPWDCIDDGWLVKTYKHVDLDNVVSVDKPESLTYRPYCTIDFNEAFSLPDWRETFLAYEEINDLSRIINEHLPYEPYDKIVCELIGQNKSHTKLGGYPYWIQKECTFKTENGNPMKLLAQVSSNEQAEIIWGDAGDIYIFYDENDISNIEFCLQCY